MDRTTASVAMTRSSEAKVRRPAGATTGSLLSAIGLCNGWFWESGDEGHPGGIDRRRHGRLVLGLLLQGSQRLHQIGQPRLGPVGIEDAVVGRLVKRVAAVERIVGPVDLGIITQVVQEELEPFPLAALGLGVDALLARVTGIELTEPDGRPNLGVLAVENERPVPSKDVGEVLVRCLVAELAQVVIPWPTLVRRVDQLMADPKVDGIGQNAAQDASPPVGFHAAMGE